MNKKYLRIRMIEKDITMHMLASKMDLKPDSLYRKIAGVNGWKLKDVKIIIKELDTTFENLFGSND